METRDILEELYERFQEEMPCGKDDVEILRVRKRLGPLIEDPDNENAILDYGIAYEKAGFRYGFILAVRIMAQCVNGISVSVS